MTRKALEDHLARGKTFLLKRKPATFDASPEVEKLKREIQTWNSEALALLKKTPGAKGATSEFTLLGRMKYETLVGVKDQLKMRRKVIEQFLNEMAKKTPKPTQASRKLKAELTAKSSQTNRRSKYPYDVCLSFAGEDRKQAKQLYDALTAEGVKVFYDFDDDIAAELWGKDLYAYLDDIYQNKAKHCIMFISKYYVRKVWTKQERESAQARVFLGDEDYILPLRLDNTPVPGVRATRAFRKWSEGVPEITKVILKKLKKTIPAHLQTLLIKKTRGLTEGSSKIASRVTGHTILLGSQMFRVEHLTRVPNQHIEIRLKVSDQQLKTLRAFESPPYGAKKVPFADRFDASDVQVSVLNETTARGIIVVNLKLTPVQTFKGHGGHRATWNGKSLTETAQDSARQLLLGEQPQGDSWSRPPSDLSEELKNGILPLAIKSVTQGENVLQLAKLLAVYHLHSANIVDEINELMFKRLKNGKISVSFKGKLIQTWTDETGDVSVRGTVAGSV